MMITCNKCGQTLPEEKFERLKSGTRRRVCNHCKWIYYVQPSRNRRIIRESEGINKLKRKRKMRPTTAR